MLNTALKQIIVKNYEICDKLGEGLLHSPHFFRKVQVVPHFLSGYLKLILLVDWLLKWGIFGKVCCLPLLALVCFQ